MSLTPQQWAMYESIPQNEVTYYTYVDMLRRFGMVHCCSRTIALIWICATILIMMWAWRIFDYFHKHWPGRNRDRAAFHFQTARLVGVSVATWFSVCLHALPMTLIFELVLSNCIMVLRFTSRLVLFAMRLRISTSTATK